MLKLMNSLLMLVILCGGLKSINGEALQCEFKDFAIFGALGTLYSCVVTALENPNDNKIITGYNGVHQSNKNDRDVKQIYIPSLDIKYIPAGLGSLSNLLGLAIQNSQLVEIRSKDFQGMQDLEYLSFHYNKITSVPSDTFSTLPKLKEIFLNHNQIKYIGSGAFDQLTNLDQVHLEGNICVNKYYEEATAITQMKEDLKANCQNPNDVIQYEIEHKISDESSRNRKEFELLNEKMDKTKDENHGQLKALNDMIKKLLKATEEHQKDRDEIVQLKSELSTSKEEQKMEQEAKTKVINEVIKERDQLMNENADLKEMIQQKLPKMEQTINEFHMEVIDQKIEHHYQRETSIALRSKLMEAKEQLAECQIIERISC